MPINSLQSDGTINISHNLENISNISLTINDCSVNMYQLKQLLLLMLFGISIVNFTLTILNTQNIAVNSTLLQQVNTTTAVITKDVLRISNHLSGTESWKYILKLTRYFDEIFPQASYFDGIFSQISKIFASICVFVSTKPMSLVPIFGICTQMILFVHVKVARFRNLLGCLLWGFTLYLQEQRALVEDNILSRVSVLIFLNVNFKNTCLEVTFHSPIKKKSISSLSNGHK